MTTLVLVLWALATALADISRRQPIMGSTGEYRRGQLHALEACRTVADAALRAYRGEPCPICGNAGVDSQGYECLCKEASHDAE